jgi:hypothetical protein
MARHLLTLTAFPGEGVDGNSGGGACLAAGVYTEQPGSVSLSYVARAVLASWRLIGTTCCETEAFGDRVSERWCICLTFSVAQAPGDLCALTR